MNELTYKTEKGENVPQKTAWRWSLAAIFIVPAFALILIAQLIMRLADFILFDTHHFELKVIPKIE